MKRNHRKNGKAFSQRKIEADTRRDHGKVETCPFETRHRNNPGMARGWPSHDAKETRPPLSASLLCSSAPLGTDDRKKLCPALAALAYDLNSIDTAGPSKKERSTGRWREPVTLNVPRSSRLKFVARELINV